MFVDIGVLGGLAYLVFYLLGVVQAGRAFLRTRGRWESALPMAAAIGGLALLPITLTSDMWGDLSVLFVFWWAVGYSASLAADKTLATRPDSVQHPAVASS
jgi:hypothetical protein